jgi:hypothetical protein
MNPAEQDAARKRGTSLPDICGDILIVDVRESWWKRNRLKPKSINKEATEEVRVRF